MSLVGKTERRDVPHEAGEWIEFRRLSGRELDEAEETQTRRSLAMVKGLDVGAMDIMRQQAPPTAPSDPVASYDKDILVRYAISGWSYGEECINENKERLDAMTRDWAAAVVVEMNVRPLGEGSGSGGNSASDESHLSLPALGGSTKRG